MRFWPNHQQVSAIYHSKFISRSLHILNASLSQTYRQIVYTSTHHKPNYHLQTCQPLRILRNHYAFRVSNTPLCKPVQNVEKLRILRNFGAIRPIPRNLQQLCWLAISRKSPAGQSIDKNSFILRLPSASASDFAIRSTKEAAEVKPCPMKRRADREPF